MFVALVLLILNGCDFNQSSRTDAANPSVQTTRAPTPAETIVFDAYGLTNDPTIAMEFEGNSDIFEARVLGIRPGHRTNPPAGQAIVFRPVDVVVTRVFLGDLRPGDRVALAALGGTAADGTTMLYEDAWPDSTWRPGTELFAFTEGPVDLGVGVTRTPNYLFVEQDGRAVDPFGEQPSKALDAMRRQLTDESAG